MPSDVKHLPIRRSRPICIAIDEDAELLLRQMAPHGKGMGALLAELIRKEARERGARSQLLKTLAEDAAREAGKCAD